MFIKIIFKDSRKVTIFINYVPKWNLYLYFLIQQYLLISDEKMVISAELKECVTLFMYFLDLHQVRYNCAKFHNCRICVADFRFQEGGPFLLPLSVSSPEKTQRKIHSQPICEIKSTQKKKFFSFFRMRKTYMFTFDSLSINDGHVKNVLQDIKQ